MREAKKSTAAYGEESRCISFNVISYLCGSPLSVRHGLVIVIAHSAEDEETTTVCLVFLGLLNNSFSELEDDDAMHLQ